MASSKPKYKNVTYPDKEYPLSEIKSAWETYNTLRAFRVLRGGKWYTEVLDGKPRGGPVDGTSAEVVKLHKVMEFPEYLEKVWKR